MDGNGRWAQSKGLPRTAGHQQGAEAVRRIVRSAADMGIEYLTLFGFSSENWNRPAEEVNELMRLLRFYLRSETAELHKNDVRLRVTGDRNGLDEDIIKMIENAEDLTKLNKKITVSMAINYGGRHEIMQAACRMAQDMNKRGIEPDMERVISVFPDYLMTKGIPDPDLLIRTSGEKRISNFMLWQCAYAEFYFTQTLWPDFSREDLQDAVDEFYNRERRYGKLGKEKVRGGEN
jgi:undecaprenyl diphosphate synthase